MQLGATVDYAILFTQHYVTNRADHPKRESIALTVRQTFGTLLTPALILTSSGVILASISTSRWSPSSARCWDAAPSSLS